MKFKYLERKKISLLPKEPGVYCFKENKEILYIGKASNLRERVKNHFPSRSEGERRTNVLRTQHPGYKDYLFFDKIKKIGFIKTNSEIEALILEAHLIKKYQPKYNVIWRDDKNYFFVGITAENFPRLFITHQPRKKLHGCDPCTIKYIGPFVDGNALKQTLKILRKAFPYRSCKTLPKKPCLWYQLKRCPAPCLLEFKTAEQLPKFKTKMKRECQGNAKRILKILRGQKAQVLKDLKKEMKKASKSQDFERAAKRRDQIRALEKILAYARIFQPTLAPEETNWPTIQKMFQKILKTKIKINRIEAFDISNIQGQRATGSMVTFVRGKPDKNFYRRFRIKIEGKPNDIAMIKEVISRRFSHPEWGLPELILIDGGRAQLNAARQCLRSNLKQIKVMAIAKKKNELYLEKQKKPILLKNLPREIFNLILQLRDEAHRFAISYHKKLRYKALFEK